MPNLYETLLIVAPEADDEGINAVIGDLRTTIENDGATVLQAGVWQRRQLAYPVQGKTEGIYVLVYADGEETLPAALRDRMRLDESVIRSLVVRLEDKEEADVREKIAAESDGDAAATEQRAAAERRAAAAAETAAMSLAEMQAAEAAEAAEGEQAGGDDGVGEGDAEEAEAATEADGDDTEAPTPESEGGSEAEEAAVAGETTSTADETTGVADAASAGDDEAGEDRAAEDEER